MVTALSVFCFEIKKKERKESISFTIKWRIGSVSINIKWQQHRIAWHKNLVGPQVRKISFNNIYDLTLCIIRNVKLPHCVIKLNYHMSRIYGLMESTVCLWQANNKNKLWWGKTKKCMNTIQLNAPFWIPMLIFFFYLLSGPCLNSRWAIYSQQRKLFH